MNVVTSVTGSVTGKALRLTVSLHRCIFFCLFMLGARHDVCAAFTFLGACTGLYPHMIQTL